MGATTFITEKMGRTADEAFRAARDEAAYMYGHGGYTGTIAEKHEGFRKFDLPKGIKRSTVNAMIDAALMGDIEKVAPQYRPLVRRMHEVADQKWGPAACIELPASMAKEWKEKAGRKGAKGGVFVFFGWASE